MQRAGSLSEREPATHVRQRLHDVQHATKRLGDALRDLLKALWFSRPRLTKTPAVIARHCGTSFKRAGFRRPWGRGLSWVWPLPR